MTREELILEKMVLLEDLLNMVINKGFCTKICSDVDREGMIVIICYDDQIVAEINYEKGIDNMEIEIILSREGSPKRAFLLNDFFIVLDKAKQLAIQCAKE